MKKMKKKQHYTFPLKLSTVAIAVCIIIGIAAAYMNRLNNAVSTSIVNTMSELAYHDQSNIQDSINRTWSDLTYIEGKFRSFTAESLEDFETVMSIECANSGFNHIYLLAEDGKIYTDKYITYDPAVEGINGRFDLLPYFADGQERIVTRFDDEFSAISLNQSSILYGIRVNGFAVDGIPIKALIGIKDISSVRSRLVIDSFVKDGESRGRSGVIDLSGNYIISESTGVYLDDTINCFDQLDQASRTDLSSDAFREKMANGEQFSFSYTDPEGVKRQVYCLPFEDSDIPWYFLLSVRQQVFTEQNQTFLTLSLILLGSIMLIVAATVYVFYDSRSRIDEARAEARARSSFLSNMSHDIRTPLNGIIGLIYLMKKDIERGDTASIDKRLDKEAETAQYLLSLVNNILDISKLEDGKVELNNAAVSPEMIVDAIWSMQKSTIEGRGIHFVLEKEIIEPWVMGDDVLIKRILMNIVGNSAKFTPAEGTITLALRQRPVDANHVDTIFVCSDTGCGMSKKFLDHLWDRFSQERNDATPAGTGTGLGMAISKLLVDAMGGEIDVTSELGKGSTFTVTLHTKIATETPTVVLAAQPATDALQPDDGRPIRLLVAEDNELNAELLIEILESEGFEVEHAADGRQAVDKFQDSAVGAFDAILMDMQMPILDGCEASAQIRALDRADAKTVTIFACTANSFQEDREHALSVGMNDFITKPIDVHALLKKLTERQIGTQHGARTEARF